MPFAVACALLCMVRTSEVPPVRLQKMTRGISLAPAWTKADPLALGRIDESVKSDDFAQLASLGFRHVRVPLGTEDRARAAKNLKGILDAGLTAVLTVDPAKQLSWADIAALLQPFDPNKVFVEVAPEAVSAARQALPDTTLIVDLPGIPSDARPLQDANVVYRSSFWEPVAFTRQKARLDLPYPSSPLAIAELMPDLQDEDKAAAKAYGDARWDADKIDRLAKKCSDWSAKYRVALLCEFGCTIAAPASSRSQWMQDVRKALEDNGIPWEISDYDGPARLFHGAPHDRSADPTLLQALGLGQ